MALLKLERHCHDLDYLAALLRLLDERFLSVTRLQQVLGIRPGKLYRTLERAGVEFKAACATTIRVQPSFLPWSGSEYFDPLHGRVLREGRAVQADYFLIEDFEAEQDGTLALELDSFVPHVPLPHYRSVFA